MNVQRVTPILNVSNLEESFAWFEKLGWKKHWDYGDPPDFGAVHTLASQQGVVVSWPPTDMPWNVRECHIRHPDGHTMRVSAGIEDGR